MLEGNVTWEMLAALAVILAGAFGIWWRVENRVERAKKDAYHKADQVKTLADAAVATAHLSREELAHYKTHVAETYISKAGHRETTDQLMSAINGVKSAVDGTNTRIDRLFDDKPSSSRK